MSVNADIAEWHVSIKRLEGINTSDFQLGSVIKTLTDKREKAELANGRFTRRSTLDDAEILKRVVIEVRAGKSIQRTEEFDIPPRGRIRLDENILVPRPPNGERAIVRVLRLQKLLPDQLVGETEVPYTSGWDRSFDLSRRGKVCGKVTLKIGDGVPSEFPMPSFQAAPKADSFLVRSSSALPALFGSWSKNSAADVKFQVGSGKRRGSKPNQRAEWCGGLLNWLPCTRI